MIIRLEKSTLFTVDPALKFADAYKISPSIYRELWRRHTRLEYTTSELCEWFYIRVGRPIRRAKMNRWMWRNKVYLRAQDALKLGANSVASEFFGELEAQLTNELFRNIKSGWSTSLRTLA